MSEPAPVIVVSGMPGVGKSTISRLVAAAFDRSAHLRADAFLGAIVSGRVDPNGPDADRQHQAVGAALAVSAMSFAGDGYTTIVDGYLFPRGVDGLAGACRGRNLPCHYVVLTADLETCWARAIGRGEGRELLERAPFAAVHDRFAALDLPERHVIPAIRSPEVVRDEVLAAFHAGNLEVTAS